MSLVLVQGRHLVNVIVEQLGGYAKLHLTADHDVG